jgi:bifunctional non-homologous end joining protein LigD
VRAKAGAPVSAPCTWDEVERGEVAPQTFTLKTMAGRIATVGDLWSGLSRRRRSLHRPVERLKRLQTAGGPGRARS